MFDDDGPERIGQYEVVARLSVSATSEVLLARARGPFGFERPVVIKRLLTPVTQDAELSRGLAREALAYARLTHPAIVRLYDFQEIDGHLAMVLEHVEGVSLGHLRSLLRSRREWLPDGCVLYVMSHVFAALAAAHAARHSKSAEFSPVIHRDVCPDNVLLGWDGSVKLADFGFAKLAGVPGDTRYGMLKGTVGYMAPEQVTGEPVTVRTDIYQACLLLRELLLRKRTFPRGDRPELEIMGLMANPKLAPIETLRGGVATILCDGLRRGLAVDPDARGVSAAQMRDAIHASLDLETGRRHLAELLADVRAKAKLLKDEAPVTIRPVRPDEPQEAESMGLLVIPRLASMPSFPSIETSVAGIEVDARDDGPMLEMTEIEVNARDLPPPSRPTQATSTTFARDSKPPARSARPPWPMIVAAAAVVVLTVVSERAWRPSSLEPTRASAAGAPTRAPDPAYVQPVHVEPLKAPQAPAPITEPVKAEPVKPEPVKPEPVKPDPPKGEPPSASSTEGTLVAPKTKVSHRVFVDGKVLGQTGHSFSVKCGSHTVKIGSQGRAQTVEVPCGGDVELVEIW